MVISWIPKFKMMKVEIRNIIILFEKLKMPKHLLVVIQLFFKKYEALAFNNGNHDEE